MAISDEILPKAKQQTASQKSHHEEGRHYRCHNAKWKIRNPSVDEKPSSRSGEPPLLMLEPEASHWLHMTPTIVHNCDTNRVVVVAWPQQSLQLPPSTHNCTTEQHWANLAAAATVPGLVIVLTTGRGASVGANFVWFMLRLTATNTGHHLGSNHLLRQPPHSTSQQVPPRTRYICIYVHCSGEDSSMKWN